MFDRLKKFFDNIVCKISCCNSECCDEDTTSIKREEVSRESVLNAVSAVKDMVDEIVKESAKLEAILTEKEGEI